MNKQQIEDKIIQDIGQTGVLGKSISDYFFDKILPEVLRDIVSINIFQNDACPLEVGEQMKGYIKEKYNITL